MTQINAIGEACPLPVVKTKKALNEMPSGVLEVLVDNETAVQNIREYAARSGYRFEYAEQGDHYVIHIEKQAVSHEKRQGAACDSRPAPIPGKTVVILSSDTMGSGDDELGRILMKGFVFALTQLDELPDTVLLYNTGARLSAREAVTVNDLLALEKAGVKVMTCGTCLNHFGIADQLGVGEVTNMYSIASEMRSAGQILRP